MSSQRSTRFILDAACVRGAGLALVLLGASCGARPADRERERGAISGTSPNVLWICIDTLRADYLGCYGSTLPTSPRLDALAENGVRFRNAFSQAPWTKPAVPSMFTGLFPSEHQVLEGDTGDEGRVRADALAASFATAAELLHASGYSTAAFVHNAHLKPFLGMAQGFEVYEEGERSAEAICAEYLSWRAARKGPSFAYLHWLDVHWPYRPAEGHRALFPAPPADLDLSGPDARRLRDRVNDGEVVPSPTDVAAMQALYSACVHQTDAALGSLLDSLVAQGELGRTLVVITSDHGEEFYEHGKIGHGHSLRDSLLHVPLVIAGPGVSAGRVIDDPVQTLDILPTLLDWIGAKPADRNSGSSFVSALRGQAESAAGPRPTYAEVLHGSTYQRSVRSYPWKLIEEYHRVREEAEPVAGGGAGEASEAATTRERVRPGARADVKGSFDADGSFAASQLLLEDSPDKDAEIRGPIRKLDLKKPRLWIGPMEVRLDATPFVKRRSNGSRLAIGELKPGMIVDVDGEMDSAGVLKAEAVELREDKENSKTIKLEGRIEAVDVEDRSVKLLGVKVVFEDDVALPGLEHRATPRGRRRLDELGLHDPERWSLRATLYDLDADPRETIDVSATRPDVVLRLARLLSEWAGALQRPLETAEPVEVDVDTLEQLRKLGYVK